ncbi:MAG TPA: phage virion morphogenesis protein [Candidatus Angelobacter sp.]|nr:phage virion morphogenesis protein [Candidatus Angelobacter sp.]
MSDLKITVNDAPMQIALKNFSARIVPGSLLKIAGAVMRSSIEQTFRDQGSPAGSWPALAPSTLKRGKGGIGRKMLIQSGRMKNSINYLVEGNTLTIGTNLRYAAIQQKGGIAGRKGPFKKKNGRRPFIPARPFVVFRPEDPQRIADAMQRYIDAAAQESGLK